MTKHPWSLYRVIERQGWSYVIGDPTPKDSGPWRYRWEAQRYADVLNGADGENESRK